MRFFSRVLAKIVGIGIHNVVSDLIERIMSSFLLNLIMSAFFSIALPCYLDMNELFQQHCVTFRRDYLQIIT